MGKEQKIEGRLNRDRDQMKMGAWERRKKMIRKENKDKESRGWRWMRKKKWGERGRSRSSSGGVK